MAKKTATQSTAAAEFERLGVHEKVSHLRKALRLQDDSDTRGKLESLLKFVETLECEKPIIKYSGSVDLTVSLVDEPVLAGDLLETVIGKTPVRHLVDESDSFTRVILFNLTGEDADILIGLALTEVRVELNMS